MAALEHRMSEIERDYANYEGKVLGAIGKLAQNDSLQNQQIEGLQRDVKAILEMRDDIKEIVEMRGDIQEIVEMKSSIQALGDISEMRDDLRSLVALKSDIQDGVKMKTAAEANYKLLKLLAVVGPGGWLLLQWILSHVRL